jgi:hypothetical protein
LSASLTLKNPAAFFSKLVLHTDVGFAEAFMEGDFETPDLFVLLKVLLDNRNHVNDYTSWTGSILKTVDYLHHSFVRASSNQQKAKKNIQVLRTVGCFFFVQNKIAGTLRSDRVVSSLPRSHNELFECDVRNAGTIFALTKSTKRWKDCICVLATKCWK